MDPWNIGLGVADFGLGLGTALYQGHLGQQAIDIERSNLRRQTNMFTYQKRLQQAIFAREDNAVRRRVNDLKKAGLSPILAAGQGARAGAVVQSKAPQRGTAGLQMKMDAAAELRDLSKSLAEIDLINAQKKKTIQEAELIRRQGKKVEVDLEFLRETLDSRITRDMYHSAIAQSEMEKLQYEVDMMKIDKDWKEALKEYIERKGIKNPKVVEYIMAKTLLDIKAHDFAIFQKLKMPMDASMTLGKTTSSLGSNLGGAIADFIRAEFKGLTGR